MGTVPLPMSESAGAKTLQIQLKCGIEDTKYRAAHNATLSVPSTVGRKALSNILHALLSLETKQLFHFLIDEEPLRSTLDKFLTRRNRSSEQTLQLIYYLPPPPPAPSPPAQLSEHWLCAINAASDQLILSGGYSASPVVKVGEDILSDELVAHAHKAGIKAVSWLPSQEAFLTASLDRTVRLWDFSRSPLSASPVAQFSSDETDNPSSFTCLAVRNDTAALGSENGTIWYIPSLKFQVPTSTKKRPRLESLSVSRLAQTPSPLPITSVKWDGENLVSAGWDPLARYWDLEKCVSTLSIPCGGKPVTDIDVGDRLLVSAVDGGVRMVDSRDGKGVVGACGKRYAHDGIVAGVRWLGKHAAVSAGFDGSLRFWDVRAFVAPTNTVEKVHDGGRCLAVDAVKHEDKWSVFTAGEDGKIAEFTM